MKKYLFCAAFFCFAILPLAVHAVSLPDQLRVSSVTQSRASLRWKAATNTEYAVFNAISGNMVQDFATKNAYTAKKLHPQSMYSYWLVARNKTTGEMSRISDALYVLTLSTSTVPIGERKIVDAATVHAGRDFVMGSSTAPITLLVYTDFSCPFCREWHKTMRRLLKEHHGDVNMVYRYFPLKAIHPDAALRAHAAECAKAQGKFEAFLPGLFARETADATSSFLRAEAVSTGMNEKAFALCLSTPEKSAWRLQQDEAAGYGAGVKGTPFTVLLKNGKKVKTISGAVNYAEVEKMVEDSL